VLTSSDLVWGGVAVNQVAIELIPDVGQVSYFSNTPSPIDVIRGLFTQE
jgi:hypothetical protein